jgi:predicted 2-oxoglutarate/Fe(II)-dependent dioxygenase YbiX
MNKDLNFYIKKTKNFLDKQTCEKLIKQIDKCVWEDHEFYFSKNNISKKISGEQELEITTEQVPLSNLIMEKIWQEIHDYIKHINLPWFNSWTGYTLVRFNRYKKNKKMAEHCDHIQSMFDGNRKGVPILSVLCVLNDNYLGGKFTMFGNEEIKFKQGDLIIFPSNFLYPHKVGTVTKGTRYSFISWVW